MPAASRSPGSWCSRATSPRSACRRRKGLVLTETCVLGPQRREPRLDQALAGGAPGQIIPTMVHAGVYSSRPPLPQGGRGASKPTRRRPRRGRQDEGAADRRSAVRQGHRARRRPQDPRRLSLRSEEALRVRSIPATSTRPAPPSPPRKPSARSRKAAARWSRVRFKSLPVFGEGRVGLFGSVWLVERTPPYPPRRRGGTRSGRGDVRNLRHSVDGAVRAASARAHQRLVLRDPEPRSRRHLRHAQHHQLRARRPVHDGRLRGVPAARQARHRRTGRRWCSRR